MIRSMTGYGRTESAWAGGAVAVELRAVNHRFCEVVTRLPRTLSGLEDDLKRTVQGRCQRGRIELSVSLTGVAEGEKALSLDRSLAKQYYHLLRDLQRELRLGGTVDVALLAGFRDIVTVSEQLAITPRLKQLVKRLAAGALDDLDAMRRREGQALARDTKARLRLVRKEAQAIGIRAPLVVRGYFDRMKERVEKLAGTAPIDQGRLSQELAQYADRCDLTEELTRLNSHLSQFDAALKSRESVGRTMDFLLQEMGREVNTIGSKGNDAEIASHVVRIKSELEKIREQVQNIE
ncbi:MAG: YicC family protein [Nitrospirae bacterium]|nr:MAG: YicC family protein [Nitrospirota bacterium]